MPEAAVGASVRPPTARLWLGAGILVIWLCAKLIGPIVIVTMDISAQMKALLTAVLFIGVSKVKFADRVANA